MRPRAPRRVRAELILVIGGGASGKSDLALKLAGTVRPRAFVATGQPRDEEMIERIRRHQSSRGSTWETAEVPIDLAKWFETEGARYQVIVLDCITLWLSNLWGAGVPRGEINRLTTALIDRIRRVHARVVVVTNELGMGLVPMEAESRSFRETAGAVNQRLAGAADAVYFAVAGLSLRLK